MASSADVALDRGGSVSGEVERECSGVAPVEGGSYRRKKRLTGSVARRSMVRLLKAFKARFNELGLVSQ